MSRLSGLDRYRLLGRSGLRISPLALGTLTFGSDLGLGPTQNEARRMFDVYVDRGGNLIDTANQYTQGSAETFVGAFAQSRRDRLVIATKYTLAARSRDPNSGGNHRKSMVCSVETSLRRMRTDYIDLLYLHAWDSTTPVEEVLRAMDDLVRAGKVLYLGMSDTPAWQISRMQTIADLRGWSPLIAMQLEYNLIERTGDRELIPMAGEMGLGVLPWSPLAGGVLAGKYTEADLRLNDGTPYSRRSVAQARGSLSERGLTITEVARRIAKDIGRSVSQVALAWLMTDARITAPVIGARTLQQLEDNLDALEVTLAPEQRAALDEASAVELGFPYDFLARPLIRQAMFGEVSIARPLDSSRRQAG